jgi:tetratricopeptide (TPR) repeat protein
MEAREAYEVGEYETAVRSLQDAIAIAPENSSLWFDLAKAYRDSDDPEQEIECYKQIVVAKNDDAEVWLNMALAFRVMGKSQEELFSLIRASDKGRDRLDDVFDADMVVNRYKELLHKRILPRNPLSEEFKVPIYEPEKDEASDQGACIVCFLPIDKQEEIGQILMCPHCRRIAHFVCLASWLQTNNICPVCQGQLDFSLEEYDMRKVMGVDQAGSARDDDAANEDVLESPGDQEVESDNGHANKRDEEPSPDQDQEAGQLNSFSARATDRWFLHRGARRRGIGRRSP